VRHPGAVLPGRSWGGKKPFFTKKVEKPGQKTRTKKAPAAETRMALGFSWQQTPRLIESHISFYNRETRK
jgi:hypothetical protein